MISVPRRHAQEDKSLSQIYIRILKSGRICGIIAVIRRFEGIDMKKTCYLIFLAVVTALIIYGGISGYGKMKSDLEYTGAREDIESGVPEERIGALHFNKLTRKEQYIYDALAKAAEEYDEYTEKMPLIATEEELRAAVNALLNDRPDLFYINAMEFSLSDRVEIIEVGEGDEPDETEIIPVFTEDKYTRIYMPYMEYEDGLSLLERRFYASVSKVDTKLEGVLDPYLRAEVIHRYIIDVCCKADGVDDGENVSNVYGALVEGEADSGGYAKAFKLLWERYDEGICHIMGYGGNYFAVILTDDGYFAVDPYGDDTDGVIDGVSLPGAVSHLRLCIGTEAADKLIPGAQYSDMPHCLSGKDYYTYNDYTADTEGELLTVLERMLGECDVHGRSYFDLRYTGDDGPDAVKKTVTELGRGCEVYTLSSEMNVYVVDISPRSEEAQ